MYATTFPLLLLGIVLASKTSFATDQDKPTGVDFSLELLECMKQERECSKRENDHLIKMHALNYTVTTLNHTVFQERAEKERLAKYILILAVRSRMEELEVMILSRKYQQKPRNEKWTHILSGDIETMHFKEEVLSLRNRIPENWRGDCVRMLTILYGDFSDIAAHRVKYPINYADDTIIEMFQAFSITPDDMKVNAVKAILAPLP